MTRVFITGMGAVTPIGNDVPSYWQNLVAGHSGAARLTAFDPGDMPYTIACEVKDYASTLKAGGQTLPRATQFALSVVEQALADARLAIDAHNSERIGVFMATGGSGLPMAEVYATQLADEGWQSLDALSFVHMMPNEVSCEVAIRIGARGPVMTHTLACASGHYSVLEAMHFLRRGEADVIVAGGTESSITPLTLAAFGRMGALASRTAEPERACRPFSIDRDGLVAGEGAAAVVLETEAHARARSANIYAEILGGKLSGDAYHITAPEPAGLGATRALQGALRLANVAPQSVDVVYAHGTGTPLNDGTEAQALAHAFGSVAGGLKITSIKSMIGHGFGAAGAQSLVAAIFTLCEGIVPPTINYTPDPAIDLHIVGNQAERVDARHALINAFGFGGHNVVLVVGRVES